MTRKRSHSRPIHKEQLQWTLAILKDADGPMTQGDVRRELTRRGLEGKVEAIPTVIWEIGQNPGHTTSGGIRFPDGKYRYWLIAAPEWTPRWYVDGWTPGCVSLKTYEIKPYGSQATLKPAFSAGAAEPTPREEVAGPRACLVCGAELPPGMSSFCGDPCQERFFKERLMVKP